MESWKLALKICISDTGLDAGLLTVRSSSSTLRASSKAVERCTKDQKWQLTHSIIFISTRNKRHIWVWTALHALGSGVTGVLLAEFQALAECRDPRLTRHIKARGDSMILEVPIESVRAGEVLMQILWLAGCTLQLFWRGRVEAKLHVNTALCCACHMHPMLVVIAGSMSDSDSAARKPLHVWCMYVGWSWSGIAVETNQQKCNHRILQMQVSGVLGHFSSFW